MSSNASNPQTIPPSSTQRGAMTQRLYDYYGASGVIDKVEVFIFDDNQLLIAEDGANLVLRNLPLAIIARGKFWVNNQAHIPRSRPPPTKPNPSPEFRGPPQRSGEQVSQCHHHSGNHQQSTKPKPRKTLTAICSKFERLTRGCIPTSDGYFPLGLIWKRWTLGWEVAVICASKSATCPGSAAICFFRL